MKPFELNPIINTVTQGIEALRGKIYRPCAHLKTEVYCSAEPLPYAERMKGDYRVLNIGDEWGGLFDCAWFHFTGTVPAECAGQKTVLCIDVNGEGCIYDDNGVPVQGITCVASEFDRNYGAPGKRIVCLSERAKGGEKVDIWMDAGNNDLFGRYLGGLKEAEIAVCREDIRQLYYDFFVLDDLRGTLHETAARYYSILYAEHNAIKALRDDSAECVAAARRILKTELEKRGGSPSLTFSAVGHSHLDLAWLWPLRETHRKAARTFSTALKMLDEYPDYIYGASQPQQFQWIKTEHPKLFEKIRQKVKEGRIEPQGCMWVESDTNLAGGESLIRQILYGLKFFKEEFGAEIDTLWLPDVFGFSAALPQILQKSGIKHLVTIKLTWNRFNEFPHDTFYWIGNGKGKVLVHMPPDGTYNSAALPKSIRNAENKYTEKGKAKNALLLFGIGDGGGGPGEEHLESLKRIKNLDGICPVRQETSKVFFRRLKSGMKDIPVYDGELYLEAHQGTYTSQGMIKYYNRRLEKLLSCAEILCSLTEISGGTEYPKAKFEEIWKEVLLYQFHDILPGSSIKRVYDECRIRYPVLEREVVAEIQSRLGGNAYNAVFNPLGFVRKSLVNFGSGWIQTEAEPLGFTPVKGSPIKRFTVRATERYLENESIRAEFDDTGAIVALRRKGSKRNVLQGQGGNIFRLYKDFGDAWDMNPDYVSLPAEKITAVHIRSYTDGPYAVREQIFRCGDSEIVQKVTLKQGEEYLAFENETDWKEANRMLRVDFNTSLNVNRVKCNIQFGNIERSTTENTLHEYAQYEICAHKFVQLKEGECSISLMNDCKYGHRVKDGVISLNLLRTTSYPCKEQDIGYHKFCYGLYVAEGKDRTEQIAYEFNYPLYPAVHDEEFSLASASPENIIIETVKKSENEKGYILRAYESRGNSVLAKIYLPDIVKNVYLTDCMEVPIRELPIRNGCVEIEFEKYEIHTMLLLFKEEER